MRPQDLLIGSQQVSELFRMLGRALKPSNQTSIDYPGPRVYGCLSPDDPDDGIDFVCEVCHKKFSIPCDQYRGQFDHPPSEPICGECAEDTA